MTVSPKSVCYIVSHGFASRMIMQTDLLAKLVKQGIKVSLISPDDSDPVLSNYCNQNNIHLYSFRSKSLIWKSDYILYRTYFLEDLKSNPALYEKHYYTTHLAKHKWILGKFFPYLLLYYNYSFTRLGILRKVFKKIENSFLNSKKARDLLNNIKPNLLISTYPVNPNEGILLHCANQLNIRTCIHLLSWDNITSKGHFFSLADYYIAWGPVMKNEFVERYQIAEEKIFITGVPHFDLHLQSTKSDRTESVLPKLNLNPEKPYLIFGMSSPRFVPKEIDIVEYLADKINENEFGHEMQLVIRPHPQNVQGWMADQNWIARLNKITNYRIALFMPELSSGKLPWSMQQDDLIKLSELISGCVVCINSCSTLSIDALMSGIGNIAPMFDGDAHLPYWSSARRLIDYMHIKKFISLGGTQVVSNYNELLHEIKNFQNDPDYLKNKRNYAKTQECFISESSATSNVLNCISTLIDNL